MNARWRCVTLLAGLAVVLLSPTTAFGFKQTMTCNESGIYACDPGETPKAVHWRGRCVRYRINARGSANFTGSEKETSNVDEMRDAVRRSFNNWTRVSCSDITLVDGGLTDETRSTFEPDEGSANSNLVIWRDDGWGDVASARAFALTSVTFNPSSGNIVDADIEVNTEFYPYSASPTPAANHVDLENTMTHEVGHFIGLDHTEVREATMFATAPVGETNKRSLHDDDIKGVCHIYPSTERSRAVCNDDGDFAENEDLREDIGGTCTVADVGRRAPGGLAAAFLGLFGLAWWRRRTG